MAGNRRQLRFGQLLRSHRTGVGLTQQQLAAYATLSVRAVRDLECGSTLTPRRDTLRLLVDALGLDGAQRATFLRAARGGDSPANTVTRAVS